MEMQLGDSRTSFVSWHKDYIDIEMFGQLLPEQANAPDSATTYGFAGPVTGTLPRLLSHQLIPNLGHAIKGQYYEMRDAASSRPFNL